MDKPGAIAQRSSQADAMVVDSIYRVALRKVGARKDRKMSTAIGSKLDGSRPDGSKLYVSEGAVVKGTVLVADTVVVDGVLEGEISAGHLHVSPTGTIKGRISVAQNAEIFGEVVEKLDVRGLLILRATSRVEANVSYGMLTIEQGAEITGGISSTNGQAARPGPKIDRRPDARPDNKALALRRLDLSAMELPSPIATSA